MITNTATKRLDVWGDEIEADPRCEGCGRSLVTRFGDELPPAECPSCDADFRREAKAGHITMDGEVVEFHFPDEAAA